MQVWLIRHGITKGNLEKRYVGNTDEGLLLNQNAFLLEKKLQLQEYRESISCRDTVVYSSPRKRCLETAGILFPEYCPSVVEPLAECNFGTFEYKNYEELKYDSYYQKWVDSGGLLPFPCGESQESFQKRCVAAFDEIYRQEKTRKRELLIFVVHGGTIMSLMNHYGKPERGYFDWQPKNGCGYLCEGRTEEKQEVLEVCHCI